MYSQIDLVVKIFHNTWELMKKLLTFAVSIGRISLIVNAICFITIMSIPLNELNTDIDLLRASGAKHHQFLPLFSIKQPFSLP